MDFLQKAKAYENELIEMRRFLHENPELSGVEVNTIAYIRKILTQYGIEHVEVPQGGIIAYLGDEKKGKTVMLRCDVDALPLDEDPDNLKGPKIAVSKVKGACHACGHDAHTAMMIISAKMLKEVEADLKGRVVIVFERGEEVTGDFRYLFRYIDQQKLHVDAVYGTHLKNTIESGTISCEPNGVMAGSVGFNLKIIGKSGHGSRPDLANNPIDCFVAVYNALNALRMKYVSPFETLCFSVGSLHAGAQGNIIPDELTFNGTARFFDRNSGRIFRDELENLFENIAKAYHCDIEKTMLTQPSSGVINNPALAEFTQKAIIKGLGEKHLTHAEPWMASESFSLYQKTWPGVFCFLGIKNDELGSGAEHHNTHFDVDDSGLYVGAASSANFAYEFLLNPPELDYSKYTKTPMEVLHDAGWDVFKV